MAQEQERATIWSLPFIVLMVANFFQSMAAFMANTTIPVYLNSMGASTSIVGVVVGAFAITALGVRPFAGPAFDSFSRKRLLIASQAIICVSFALYSIVPNVPLFFTVRLLHGIGIGCSGPLAMSLVSEYLPAARLASGISIYTLAQSLAQVIGPAAGLWLIGIIGFSASYLIASALLLAAMVGIFFLQEPERERPPYQLKLGRMFAKEALPYAVVLALVAISFSCTGSYLVLYTMETGVEGVGIYFTVYALCLVATRPTFGRLADNWGAERVLLIGLTCFAVSYILLSQTRSFGMLMACAVTSAGGFGACAPLVQSLALGSVAPQRRGAASNTSYTGLDIGMLVGPGTGGIVTEMLAGFTGNYAAAYSNMWLVMLIPVAIAFAIVLSWNIRKR